MSDTNPTGWKKTADDLFARVRELEAKNERMRAEWERYFGFTFDESGFMELYAMVMGYDERKEIGDPIFTVAQFEEREAENEQLTAELAAVRAELAECQAALQTGVKNG